MRSIRSIAILATLAATLVVPAAVSAATVDECQAQISSLGSQTDAATFIGKNAAKEEAGLLGKLSAASNALAVGKTGTTITKLADFRSQVVTLGQTGKLAPSDADALVAGADAATACVNSIGA